MVREGDTVNSCLIPVPCGSDLLDSLGCSGNNGQVASDKEMALQGRVT